MSVHHHMTSLLRFYDFFAGAGLAATGLAPEWECIWANDIDPKKASVYRRNCGDNHFHLGDVANFTAADLPNHAQLAWASFPCQDLSLAGWQRGLSANRSGTFWPFWKIMRKQFEAGGRPPIIVLENVLGLLHGDSFSGLCEAFADLGMQFGALVMDARLFLPQSRPRVFVVGVDSHVDCSAFVCGEGCPTWTPQALVNAHARLSPKVSALWRWWNLPTPTPPLYAVEAFIEDEPTGVAWHTQQETTRLLGMMNELHLGRVAEAKRAGTRRIGFVYKRIRDGVQRAEVRFDGIAGCLRTPQGGSSRQTVVVVEGRKVRSRLLSPREAARLMGVPDSFKLPEKYNDAYKAMGDGVAVPVVSWLSRHLLLLLAETAKSKFNGDHHAAVRLSAAHAHKRADGWAKEHKRMAPVRLVVACEKVLADWHRDLDSRKSTGSDSFIACAGIKVAELTKTKWPLERADYVSTGSRFRST
ncbi:MAG: DNA cytosine methyltransferase, partial [Candidatus Sulfotelmatobacter sp.]